MCYESLEVLLRDDGMTRSSLFNATCKHCSARVDLDNVRYDQRSICSYETLFSNVLLVGDTFMEYLSSALYYGDVRKCQNELTRNTKVKRALNNELLG